MNKMLSFKRFCFFAAITIFIAFTLTACGGSEESSGGQVFFRVTRDFGRQELFAGQVHVTPGESALEALQRHLKVQTGHGGRFVTSIEGLASTAKGNLNYDWFFYANGITASVGGGDYYPREGDVIWWDYRAWGDSFFTPAVTGAFPQPFINGYRGNNPGTAILYTDAGREGAEKLRDYLHEIGVGEVRTEAYGEYDLANPKEILMVIALWPELADEPFWQGMVDNREKIGWFARLDTSGFTATGLTEEQEVYGSSAGVILASGSGLGDATPLWLLTALDEVSLNKTADLLVENPQSLQGTYGVLITDGGIIRLPL